MKEPHRITRDMAMGEAFQSVVTRFPHRVALVSDGERITYQQLHQRVQALTFHLSELGVTKRDRIATLLWSVPEFIYLFLAAAELGAVISPLAPRLRQHQLKGFLRELEPKWVVTSTKLQMSGGLDALYAIQQELPSVDHVIVTDAPQEGGIDFWELLKSPSLGDFIPEQVRSQDLLAILYTSGTTGRPKGVMHSHRGLITPVVASVKLREMWMSFFPTLKRVRRWLRVLIRYGVRLLRTAGRQQTFLSTMSMHTISGLEAMLQALLMGDKLVLLPRFHPVHALEAIQRERVTVLIGVPLSYVMMMRVHDFERFRLSSLLICAAGAAPCSPELAREIQRRFGCAVHVGFGLAELGGGIAATMLDDTPNRQAETVGQPMPGMEVLIVDEDRRPLPPGQIGELACRAESMMLGYFGDQDGGEDIVDDAGFLYTGDLAMIDEDGYIHIVGRKKDMIIRGGQNIYPVKIERLLVAVEGIREAAVVGVPDEMGTERVWAFVIVEDGARLTEKIVLDHCRAQLEAYEMPEQVRFVDDFPRASSSKAQKYQLREMAMEETHSHG